MIAGYSRTASKSALGYSAILVATKLQTLKCRLDNQKQLSLVLLGK